MRTGRRVRGARAAAGLPVVPQRPHAGHDRVAATPRLSCDPSRESLGDDVENSRAAPSLGCTWPTGPPSHKENTMAKYLLLKHYRGAPAPANDIPMDQWKPEEVEAHIKFMQDFGARLEASGELVDAQALSPEGSWVRYDGDGPTGGRRRPVRRDQGPDRRMDGDRRRQLRACHRARRCSCRPHPVPTASRSTSGSRSGRSWPRRPTSPSDRGRRRAPRARPAGVERPRPSRRRLRDGRGRGPGGAHPSALHVG